MIGEKAIEQIRRMCDYEFTEGSRIHITAGRRRSISRSGKSSKFRQMDSCLVYPSYRRQVIYKNIRADVGQILGTLCRRKGIEIIEAEACPDHIHMLIRIPPKYSVSEIMGYLKGKSSLMIFEKHANPKYKYGNRHFWCRGYYVDTVGKNTAAIKKYIQDQLKEDLEYDQMSLVEYIDPFTGEPVKKNKK